ncbi:Ribulose-5-phosphate 4-epimerase/Fuculose-1-phosphate aldolase AraD [Methanonatronarchaeum thermophilum]|uniref:Ribulose-5-phosphate 4-epimerase/Fuculose-1-phosphate aldolase AraD n=1 Tax=Methanonatronarchaeum thermophilum TaxID=1927129 RepID=A0A1Y3G9T5_9EURY|nr:class II aldolase/adducin family protein [Methanonatronarchaeum thermophilum]OUJ18169.1 Ribulose-5-phosphate 4-epimerase/Fuculose-1-phosphate aldolase AraD [Methanonatronarchaeum thermophilum]
MNKVGDIVKIVKCMGNNSFFPGYSGNISVYEDPLLLISSSGTDLKNITTSDFVFLECRLDSFQLKQRGGGLVPSSETPLHIKTYEKTGPGCILHSHPDYSVVLSEKIDEIEFRSEGALELIGNKIEVLPEFDAGSLELAEKVSDYLKKNEVALVRNHGLFVKTDSLERAVSLTETVERDARQYYLELVIDG